MQLLVTLLLITLTTPPVEWLNSAGSVLVYTLISLIDFCTARIVLVLLTESLVSMPSIIAAVPLLRCPASKKDPNPPAAYPLVVELGTSKSVTLAWR